jgi:hypothetical protein
MKLADLQQIVGKLLDQYDSDTEVEFSIEDERTKLSLMYVNHFREITTAVQPRIRDIVRQVDTIFMVFSKEE